MSACGCCINFVEYIAVKKKNVLTNSEKKKEGKKTGFVAGIEPSIRSPVSAIQILRSIFSVSTFFSPLSFFPDFFLDFFPDFFLDFFPT